MFSLKISYIQVTQNVNFLKKEQTIITDVMKDIMIKEFASNQVINQLVSVIFISSPEYLTVELIRIQYLTSFLILIGK